MAVAADAAGHQESVGEVQGGEAKGVESRMFEPKKERLPFEVPTKGGFWMHDDRFDAGDPGRC